MYVCMHVCMHAFPGLVSVSYITKLLGVAVTASSAHRHTAQATVINIRVVEISDAFLVPE